MTKPLVISLMGPTASGKTDLSIELAKTLGGEIISVDSALIYKDMDIGTAKPTEEERQGIPHWLIDIKTPEQQYSVADFVKDANNQISDILKRGRIPILAGGTMLYFNALINGISEVPTSDEKTRMAVKEEIAKNGLGSIFRKLVDIDPAITNRIHQNDTQRLSRAYEVFIATGKPLSYWQSKKSPGLQLRPLQFALLPDDRAVLHEKIALRFDKMLSSGLIEEVKFLLQKYQLKQDLPSMRSVGYRQIYAHLHNECSHENMREQAIAATRQLAKRQLTWLRGWSNVVNLSTGKSENLRCILEKIDES